MDSSEARTAVNRHFGWARLAAGAGVERAAAFTRAGA